MSKNRGELLVVYTREQAIEDGLLVDISETHEAKEAGFTIPVAVTHHLYGVVEDMPSWEDLKGRLWDLCFMAATAFRRAQDDKRIVPFKCGFSNRDGKLKIYSLWLVFDEYEGFTLMFPEDY